MGTQLIVQEGQAALFVCGGVVADVFYPGTHTLSTDNILILKKLINLPFGGMTPFSAAMGMGASMNQTIDNSIYKEEMKECVSCHAKIPAGSKFCQECGFNNSGIICECGNKLAPGTKFCPECGKKVQ